MVLRQLHEDLGREDKVKLGSDKKFGLTIGVVLLLLSALGWYRGSGHWHLFGLAALPFVVLGLFAPSVLHFLNQLWFKFGLWLAKIVQPVVLALMFYAVLTPFAAVYRMFSRRPIGIGESISGNSYWIKRTPVKTTDDFKNQF
jgi:hypothetical protein